MRDMPRVPPFDRPATYEDLARLPDHLVAEIVNGELHASPRPAPRHAVTGSIVGGMLVPPYFLGRGGPGGSWILYEPEVHLGPDVLVPDWAGWRRKRMEALPATAYFEVAPDWVCEILSPSTASLDRAKKLAIYAREKVLHAWLIDPIARTLEVLRLADGRWSILAVHAGDEEVRAEPFGDVVIELRALWADQSGGMEPSSAG
jgi:Uma2 family endonuclease